VRITDFFSEPVQSTLRNALEAISLAQPIVHSYLSRRRSRHRKASPARRGGTCVVRDAVTAASRR